MGLFTKKPPPAQPARPAARTIPTLWPDYYSSIHERLVRNGGADSAEDIAFGVGNAIFNTALKAIVSPRHAREFETLYADRTPADVSAPDKMIDYLVTYDPSVQSGEGGWLGTLLGRLDEVLSRPA